MKFSYISPTEFESEADSKSGANSVDYSQSHGEHAARSSKGHVLVLDFHDDVKGRKNAIAAKYVQCVPFY